MNCPQCQHPCHEHYVLGAKDGCKHIIAGNWCACELSEAQALLAAQRRAAALEVKCRYLAAVNCIGDRAMFDLKDNNLTVMLIMLRVVGILGENETVQELITSTGTTVEGDYWKR